MISHGPGPRCLLEQTTLDSSREQGETRGGGERPWRQVTILASSPGHGQENCARCDKATRREYIQRGSSVNSALEFLIDFVPCSTRNQTMTEYGVHGVQREGSGEGRVTQFFLED